MKKEMRFLFLLLAGCLMAATLLAVPVPRNRAQQQDPNSAAAPQTVTGKVTAVSSGSFTLDVSSGFYYDEPSSRAANTMTFAIDKNTTVDGDLKVGARADVTYRSQDGKNLAISVRTSS